MTSRLAKLASVAPRAAPWTTQRVRWALRIALFASDLALINVAFALAYVIRYQWEWFRPIAFDAPFGAYLPIQALFNVTLITFFVFDGVYSSQRESAWLDQMWTLVGSVLKAVFIIWVAIFIYGPAVYSRLMILEAGALVVLLLGVTRALRVWTEAQLRARGIGTRNVLIIGAGEIGRAVMRTIFARPELGYRCVGFLDDDPERGHTDIGRFSALGAVSALPQVLSQGGVDEVVITLPWSAQAKIREVLEICQAHGVRARVAPSLLQLNLSQVNVADFGGIPVLGPRENETRLLDRALKRALDLTLGSVFALLSLPVILVAAVAIRLESPGSPIYTQWRAGQNGKPFRLYKLRSMYQDADKLRDQLQALNEADGPLFKIRDDPRCTKVGRILRKLSIDELPQFWNVLRGEMSIVGPRPALLSEVEAYRDWHRERLRVKPGITGLWQISGRSELSFEEMVLLDVYYIENWSLSLDLKIILRTIPYVLSGRGAY